MKPCSISQLAGRYELSRSALLYYDRIGLLAPSGRSAAGYRRYTEADRLRLERICGFRRAGLTLDEIRTLLATEGKPSAAILERRFHEIGEEIQTLKGKQALLARMLRGMVAAGSLPAVDRQMWVEMMQAAGMDESAMRRWHAEFEQRAPQSHHEFLRSLGIAQGEALRIRTWSRTQEGRGSVSPGTKKDAEAANTGARTRSAKIGLGPRKNNVKKENV